MLILWEHVLFLECLVSDNIIQNYSIVNAKTPKFQNDKEYFKISFPEIQSVSQSIEIYHKQLPIHSSSENLSLL